MEIKKILYVAHLGDPASDAAEGLLEIKKAGLKEIILLSEYIPQEFTNRLTEHGINLKRVEGSRPLISGIFEVAEREHASLIVVHLKRQKKGIFRGVTATNLIKNTSLPLLIIHENGGARSSSKRGLFDSVILATNWSDAARRAWLYIIGVKDIVKVLEIVYVLNQKPTIGEIRQLRGRVEEIRKICLEEKMDAESHIYAGKTPEEIILASKDYSATLIAMGYRAKGTFGEIFSRGTCLEVAEKSPLPVLIIP
jgi:nucleotide-binding universal stress UspA family protein